MATKGIKFTQTHKDNIGKANKELKGKGNVKYWLGKKRIDMVGNTFSKGKTPPNKSGHFKNCIVCNKEFWAAPHLENQKCCSVICSGKNRIGKYGGEKASNWRGGINPVNDGIRKSLDIKMWKKICLERDNWTDQKSSISGGRLVVHHINNFADYPELRTSIENGITLSEKSHIEFHKIYGRKNNTKEQMIEFLKN